MIEPWIQKWVNNSVLTQEYTIICKIMEKNNTSRDELAKKMQLCTADIDKMLDGEDTLTIRTFSDMLFHLGHIPRITSRKNNGN